MLASALRVTLAAGLVGLSLAATALPAAAQSSGIVCSSHDGSVQRACTIGLNKSLILDLPRDAFDVLVSNPAIADAVVRTPRRIYLTGVAVGQTNLFVFDRLGDVIVSLELSVERDIDGLEETLNRLIPGSAILVEMINDNIVLSGTVQNAADSGRASELAGLFANGGANSSVAVAAADPNAAAAPTSRIVNLLTIEGEDQVHLRVTVAEIERNTVKQLGIDWSAQNLQFGGAMVLGGAAESLFPGAPNFGGQLIENILVPEPGGAAGDMINERSILGFNIEALEQQGLFRTLAEPTLTAISGESASFLAGGEFPIQVVVDGVTTVMYKPYGVSLNFTPVVLSAGRISLRVETEVSEVTNDQGALRVRRASTTLELPSGGSMVLGGLLEDNVQQVTAGLPGIRDVPVLGALFGSRDFQRRETELVIIVTPYLVQPVARSELAQPDDGFAPASDGAAMFLGQLNRQYGVLDESALRGSYEGNVGFIFE